MASGVKNLISVIIPSRSAKYLQKTVDDLLTKAQGELEIIVVLDGYWPEPMVRDDPRVILIHHGEHHQNYGMRASINLGVSASKGKYIMKVDEHCVFDEGFDVKLAKDCQDDWVVTPRRYRFNPVEWGPVDNNRPLIDNMYPVYPHLGFNEWKAWYYDRQDILIDDCLGMQGSCYFMSRKHWDWMGGLDDKNYGQFHYEPQEICFKTWLGGRRVVTNKKTWYTHYLRQRGVGKDFGFSKQQYEALHGSKAAVSAHFGDYWFNNRWPQRVHDFEWLIEKFWPIPNWPDNWKEQLSEKPN